MHGDGPATRWARELHSWAIPEEIIAAAPEPPWWFPVEVFREHARHAETGPLTPTHLRMTEVLPRDGSGIVLDVGCGAGAASIPAAPHASRIVGVDEKGEMLRAFAEQARGRVAIEVVEGGWPDVAGQVPAVDVTVCANVLYNVSDEIVPFVEALTRSASRRVVVELTAAHPMSALNPLWLHFWDLERPSGPSAADAVAVIEAVTGARVEVERWTRQSSYFADEGPDAVAMTRRRLCLPASADDEVARLMRELPSDPATSTSVTMWWGGTAR